MTMSKIKNTITLYNTTHNVRRSQAITPFGIGAMIDFVDQTLMAAAPELWKEEIIIHDERLEKALGVNEFRMPPSYDECKTGLPFVRFPEWYFCPSCRRFKPINEWEEEYKKKFKPRKNSKSDDMRTPKCLECRGKPQLVPARIITVCEYGHIQDFPWVEWVHIREDKKICKDPQLKISTGANTAGLEGIKIECVCGAKTNMASSFSDDIFEKLNKKLKENGWYSDDYNFICKGHMPWKGSRVKCVAPQKTVQRGASNVYFSKVDSSIVIPPYSDKITTDIERCRLFDEFIHGLNRAEDKGKRQEYLDDYLEDYINDIASDINCNKDSVKKVIARKIGFPSTSTVDENVTITRNKYREEEYKALVGDLELEKVLSKDFKIKRVDGSKYNMEQISKVILVHKLREVRALTAFSRINPPDQNVLSDGHCSAGKIISVKEDKTDWYPAYEVRGEGIFIEFNNKKIDEWTSKHESVMCRTEIINDRQREVSMQRGFSKRSITAKFLLLHTISHILIRQLSFECGYSSASLRERIYCNASNEDYKMSGILIYTASGDAEGTLGGLVRQGLPDILPRVITNAVLKARWCSSDPVCIDSRGQGMDSLNLSACHACTLVSETSCEEFNQLLDRALIVGTLDDLEMGFFQNLCI